MVHVLSRYEMDNQSKFDYSFPPQIFIDSICSDAFAQVIFERSRITYLNMGTL